MSAPDVRQELAETYVRAKDAAAAWRMEAARVDEQAARVAVELAKLMGVGEAIRVDDVEVILEPPKPVGNRSVDKEAVHRHVETLGPMGLGPVEDLRPRPPKYPTVTELERREAQLRSVGLTLDELIDVPPLGSPQVVIKQREGVAA